MFPMSTRELVTVCPKCRLEIATGDLELNKEGTAVCSRCAMEPWEHDLTQIYASLNGVSEAVRNSKGREALRIHRQLVMLERDLMAVTQIAAQRMEDVA